MRPYVADLNLARALSNACRAVALLPTATPDEARRAAAVAQRLDELLDEVSRLELELEDE